MDAYWPNVENICEKLRRLKFCEQRSTQRAQATDFVALRKSAFSPLGSAGIVSMEFAVNVHSPNEDNLCESSDEHLKYSNQEYFCCSSQCCNCCFWIGPMSRVLEMKVIVLEIEKVCCSSRFCVFSVMKQQFSLGMGPCSKSCY